MKRSKPYAQATMLNRSCLSTCLAIVALLAGYGSRAQNSPNGSTRPSATAVSAPAALGSGFKVNYVRSREARAPISDAAVFDTANYYRVAQSTQYIDGLGRPLQTVVKQATPGLKDLVSPVVYDAYGRESIHYLPYASTDNNGSFKLDAFGSQAGFMSTQFSGESIYYSETRFEQSPLNRVKKSLAPGNSWGGSDVGVATLYLVNDGYDSVRIWNIANDTLLYNSSDVGINIPSTASRYNAGELLENHAVDEHSHHTVTYTDKDGRVVLKKVQASADTAKGHHGWLCTYYVYDDFGQLRFVIPPKATEYLDGHSWSFTNDVIEELCFRYEYDARNRMIAKKVPGAGWVYMVYDKRDRLAFTQDANMRASNQWLATIYDELNRPASTGMITYSGNRGALQWIIDTQFAAASATVVAVNFYAPDTLYVNERENGKPVYRAKEKIVFTGDLETEPTAEFETILGEAITSTTSILVGYNPLPPGAAYTGLTVNYYDTAAFASRSYQAGNNSYIDDGGNAFAESLPSDASKLTRGLLTGTRVRILNDVNNLNAGGWIETAQFYDDKGRVIQLQTENQSGGLDVTTTRYDFTGKALTLYQVHNNAAAGQTVKTKTNHLYDAAGRLLSTRKTLDNNTATMRWIERNSYDELGQLKEKRVGQRSPSDTSAMEVQAMDYNIRGWLKGINAGYSGGTGTQWFGMELNYDWGFTQPQYNGNIAGIQWRSRGDGERRAYGYGYDAVNRLLAGDFTQYTGGSWNTNAGLDFTLSGMSYDANGNILSMNQKGWKALSSGWVDQLAYTYNSNSNKLLNVIDNSNDTATRLGDFRSSKAYMTALGNSKTGAAADYSYDANGNLLKDLNKDIGSGSVSGIVYNHLNLPAKVWVMGKGNISYYYDATGNKLEKRTYDSVQSLLTRTTYINGYVYQNDTLRFMGHEDGRVRRKGDGSYVYDYFLKDHLGNTRMVLTEETQQNVYPVATLESGATDVESTYYSINTGLIVNNPASLPSTYTNNNGNPPYNSNPTSVVTATSAKMYKLNGAAGNKTGLGITLKVMSGDNIAIFGRSYWHGSSPSNSYTTVVSDLLTALAGTGAVASSGKGITAGGLTGSGTIPSEVSSFLSTAPTAGGRPKAYINWILFDEQFKVVGTSSGFDAVQTSADVLKSHTVSVDIAKNGFLYVYCSNESDQDVYFDNLQVVHNQGPLLEETHYYPFGLTMAGISSKAAGKLENRFKYNGIELDEDLGLNVYEANLRVLDQQRGVWWQIDPKVDEMYQWSPYASNFDNPITYKDPLGDDPGIAIANLNFLKGLWGGIKNGVASTGSFVKSLGTAEGWKNVGKGIIEIQPITNIIHAVKGEDGMYSSAAKGAVNYVSDIPNKSSEQIGHDVGFGLEKVGEAMLLSKGASMVGNALEAANGQTVFRVFGGDAKANGFSWTPTNPATVENIRDAAGLPSGGASGSMNTAEFVTKGKVATKNIIQSRPALPLDGNKGGLPEFIINPNDVLFKKTTPIKH